MVHQTLLYSFVARGTTILAEYAVVGGNLAKIAADCLEKLPYSNNKFIYNFDGHHFNYLVHDGFAYCVVAAESAGQQIPIAYLEIIKEEFTKRYSGGKIATAPAYSLNKEFGPKLKEQMKYCCDHPEEINKLSKIKEQVSDVKGVMMQNMDKILERGQNIDILVDKTEILRDEADQFKRRSKDIGWKMWLQNMKIKLIVLAIILAIILIILLSVLPQRR